MGAACTDVTRVGAEAPLCELEAADACAAPAVLAVLLFLCRFLGESKVPVTVCGEAVAEGIPEK
jgi:hypothetical protein